MVELLTSNPDAQDADVVRSAITNETQRLVDRYIAQRAALEAGIARYRAVHSSAAPANKRMLSDSR